MNKKPTHVVATVFVANIVVFVVASKVVVVATVVVVVANVVVISRLSRLDFTTEKKILLSKNFARRKKFEFSCLLHIFSHRKSFYYILYKKTTFSTVSVCYDSK